MRYLKVYWTHDFDDEPVTIYSEIDDNDIEVRKVEGFRNGAVHFASSTASSGDSQLAEGTMPPPEEISEDPQFAASAISPDEFEAAWVAAIEQRPG